MTVKLTKFFNSSSNAISSSSASSSSSSSSTSSSSPPPLPPPNPIGNKAHHYYHYQPQVNQEQQQKQQNHHHHQQQHHQKQQKQQAILPTMQNYSPYYDNENENENDNDDEDDDDNMSMYSTTASIMTTRDHPFNNSQRPLLPARKPTQLLHKKKSNAVNSSTSVHHQFHHHHQHLQQQQPQQQQHHYQPHAPQQRQQKSYISPYVQQQKRDSAKGLHGFNDFDILSQQYNQHLQSPHIGYPYGSPPSPTLGNSSDFVFDTLSTTATTNTTTTATTAATKIIKGATMSGRASTPVAPLPTKSNQPRYANINNLTISPSSGTQTQTQTQTLTMAMSTPTNAYHHQVINTIDYYGPGRMGRTYCNGTSQDNMGKSSRFEDDFCCRRNDLFAQQRIDASILSNITGSGTVAVTVTGNGSGSGSGISSNGGNGPFIFGLPPDQQSDLSHRMPSNGREFSESTDTVICCDDKDSNRDNYSTSLSGKSTMQQSTSDTSTSSQDSGCADISGNDKGGAKFVLLRKKCKAKKKTKKEKKIVREDNAFEAVKTQQPKPTIKCVLVGDAAVGKTNLILSYLENRFNNEHVPTASDIYNADVMVNDSPVHVTLCDTAGQDTLDPLRELCYPDSDVFLLCFSVVKPETFDAIKTKWAPKFAKTKAALILVGTQADLRTNSNVLNKLQTNGEKPISCADAWDLAASIGAKYIETSSATQDKVKEVFDTAIWDGLLPTTLPPTPPLWKKLLCLA